jgi:rhodanese-related sulfurtransferase
MRCRELKPRPRFLASIVVEREPDFELPRGRPIAVYCICGFQVSGRAVAELRQRGYDARALVGGITAWHAIDGTTVPLDISTYEEAP